MEVLRPFTVPKPTLTTSIEPAAADSNSVEKSENALGRANMISAFMREFPPIGRHLNQITQFFCGMAKQWDPGRFFGAICALVQSSGTGKSKGAFEYGRLKSWTFYICTRPYGSDGFPFRSATVADFLLHLAETNAAEIQSFMKLDIPLDVQTPSMRRFGMNCCFIVSCLDSLRKSIEGSTLTREEHLKHWIEQQIETVQDTKCAQFWEPIVDDTRSIYAGCIQKLCEMSKNRTFSPGLYFFCT
jgi:hypothetical protein